MAPPPERNNFWLTFVTGGVAGICGKSIIAPIERVKYIFVVGSPDLQPPLHLPRWLEGGQVYRPGNWRRPDVARQRHELRPHFPLLVSGPFISSFRSTNASCRRAKQMWVERFGPSPNHRHALLCGSFSGVIATTAVHPLDLLRTRMALRANDLSAYRTLVTELVRNEGFAGFFKGLGPNLSGMFIYKGISFFFYENLSSYIIQNRWISRSHFREFVAAALAAIWGQTLTYPFDVIKRRYMVLRDRQHQCPHQPHKGSHFGHLDPQPRPARLLQGLQPEHDQGALSRRPCPTERPSWSGM